MCNVGNLLRRWTNDQWASSMHRVVRPSATGLATTNTSRLSAAFFVMPNYDTVVESLDPSCDALYAPVKWADYLDERFTAMLTGKVSSEGFDDTGEK